MHGRRIDHCCSSLKKVPPKIRFPATLQQLVTKVHMLRTCAGNPDEQYLSLIDRRRGKIHRGTEESAFVDNFFPVEIDGQVYSRTVRSAKCEFLVDAVRCESCKHYRANLRALSSRQNKQTLCTPTKRTSTSSHVNFRYLNTPEKAKRFLNCSTEARVAKQKVKRLEQKLKEVTEKDGVSLDGTFQHDFDSILSDSTDDIRKHYPLGTFQRIFWDQQVESLKLKDKRQIRWHPMMIKWCLSIKLRSSSTYNALRSSNIIALPSDRTLRDYTHFIKAQTGFSNEVDQQLQREAKLDSIPDFKRHVCLVFDEVKVKEDLVYDKHTGELIGFVNIGEINNQLLEYERSCMSDDDLKPQLASHMLVFMVRGLLSNLKFPYAQFACTSVTGDQLYSLVWGCIHHLEAAGFKVLATTCDGASPNRKFIKLHGKPGELVYKTINPFSDEPRPLFFFSDVPHLIKTTRNCWANSFAHTKSRTLWVRKDECMCA